MLAAETEMGVFRFSIPHEEVAAVPSI